MEINNINLLLPFIKPQSNDDFYYLQILQRKKENPELGSNSRVIKNYYIKSQEELLNKYEEIKKLCQLFNARASLRLNKRSFEKVAFKSMVNIANSMGNREYEFIKASYDRACGLSNDDKERKWIVDIDFPQSQDRDYIEKMKELINEERPEGDKILLELPTKTGIHLITKPFDARRFHEKYLDTDIHRDNPTVLYYKN